MRPCRCQTIQGCGSLYQGMYVLCICVNECSSMMVSVHYHEQRQVGADAQYDGYKLNDTEHRGGHCNLGQCRGHYCEARGTREVQARHIAVVAHQKKDMICLNSKYYQFDIGRYVKALHEMVIYRQRQAQ